MKKDLRKRYVKSVRTIAGTYDKRAARIGKTKTVIQTAIPGVIYCRLSNGQVISAVNSIAPLIFDYPVTVGRNPKNQYWEVIEIRQPYAVPLQGGLVDHHETHEYPNRDTVFVHGEQFLPFDVLPDQDNAFHVNIYGGVVTINDTRYLIDNQTMDLSAYALSTGAKWLLLEINSSGELDVVLSADYGSKEALTPDLVPPPDESAWDMCAIKFYAGQATLQRNPNGTDDFLDLRWGRSAVRPGSDTNAIHIDRADEFSGTSEKANPAGTDRLLLEDSEDGFFKKYIHPRYRQFTWVSDGSGGWEFVTSDGEPVLNLVSLE